MYVPTEVEGSHGSDVHTDVMTVKEAVDKRGKMLDVDHPNFCHSREGGESR